MTCTCTCNDMYMVYHMCNYELIFLANECPTPVVKDSVNFPPPSIDAPPRRNFTYGDRVTIQCRECHRPVGGSVNLTCLQGGRWDNLTPKCECM